MCVYFAFSSSVVSGCLCWDVYMSVTIPGIKIKVQTPRNCINWDIFYHQVWAWLAIQAVLELCWIDQPTSQPGGGWSIQHTSRWTLPLLKALGMANHAHAWWHNRSPLKRGFKGVKLPSEPGIRRYIQYIQDQYVVVIQILNLWSHVCSLRAFLFPLLYLICRTDGLTDDIEVYLFCK